MMDEFSIFYFIVGLALLILTIIMIVKFFHIASDIRIIRDILIKFSNKEDMRTSSRNADKVISNIISGQESNSNSKGDLNDPEVLNSLLGLINQQK